MIDFFFFQDGQKEPLFRVQQNHDQRMGVFPNNTLYIREVRPDKDPLGVTCVAEAEQSEQSHAKLIVKGEENKCPHITHGCTFMLHELSIHNFGRATGLIIWVHW